MGSNSECNGDDSGGKLLGKCSKGGLENRIGSDYVV